MTRGEVALRRNQTLATIGYGWERPLPSALPHDLEWLLNQRLIEARVVGRGRTRHREIRRVSPASVNDVDRNQLTLFEDPREVMRLIKDGVWSSSDLGVGGASQRGYARKLREGQANGTCDSIAREGIKTPVVLKPFGVPGGIAPGASERVQMGNGHHRTACAADLGMAFMPVVWGRNTFATINNDGMGW